MAEPESAINYVLKIEGGLVENKNDPGGITNFGISLRFLKEIPTIKLRSYGIYDESVSAQTIRDLTRDQAVAIYKGEYWDNSAFASIFNQDTCNYIFDMAVNHGIAMAIKLTQRALWACFKRTNIIDDGILGAGTLLQIRNAAFLLMPALRATRAGYYQLLVAIHPSDEQFLEGWLKRAYQVQT